MHGKPRVLPGDKRSFTNFLSSVIPGIDRGISNCRGYVDFHRPAYTILPKNSWKVYLMEDRVQQIEDIKFLDRYLLVRCRYLQEKINFPFPSIAIDDRRQIA